MTMTTKKKLDVKYKISKNDIRVEKKEKKVLKVEILSLRSDTFRGIDRIVGQFGKRKDIS